MPAIRGLRATYFVQVLRSWWSQAAMTVAHFMGCSRCANWPWNSPGPCASPGTRSATMGAFSSPLVAEYCAGHALKVDARNPGPEGYILRTGPEIVVVAGSDDRGAFYGLQSLRRLAVELSGAHWRSDC